jgi:hypothetical protein
MTSTNTNNSRPPSPAPSAAASASVADRQTLDQHSAQLHHLTSQFTALSNLLLSVDSKLTSIQQSTSIPVAAAASSAIEHKHTADEHASAVKVHTNTPTSNVSSTLSNRLTQADRTSAAAKALYDLAPEDQQSIFNYSTSHSLEETVAMEEAKVSSAHTSDNKYNFISKLLPVPIDAAANPPSLDVILKAGFRATASNPRVKDPLALVQLLLEQAHIVSSGNDKAAVAEFMVYSLQLIKLLLEFGLQATTEFHFAAVKQMQQSGSALTANHPLLLFELMTKYRRLNQLNALNSVPVNSSSAYASKSKPRLSKFTGKPCEYHSKQLGRPANHSDADCRAAKQKQ